MTAHRKIEALKSNREYFAAGQLARRNCLPRSFGCHVGMKSTLDEDRAEFFRGHDTPITYWALLAIEDGEWAVQFGDYDRNTVREELEDMATSNRRANLKIVQCTDEQSSIDRIVADLNAR
jgi:hypothetical protein